MAKGKVAAPCSHAEFESLPEPLKRKCFSSVERLRIEEEYVQQEHHMHNNNSSRQSSRTPSIALHRSLTLRARHRLRKQGLKQHHVAAHADAQFFLSLPDKVKRSAFSREEQVLLAGCYQSPLAHESRQHSSNDHANHFGDFQFDFAPQPGRGRSRTRSSSFSSFSSISPTRGSIYPSQQARDTESSLLYLDTMSSSSHRSPSSSYRRTLSLTHLPYAGRASTSSAPPTESQLNRVSVWHQRAHSQSVSGRRSSHTPASPVFDPEATHYRDPEARKKLRTLASPQKFDEAVEFGFAPTANRETKAAHYQLPAIATDARNFSRDMQTFLKDDRISFLEDRDDEENKGLESDMDSVADLDSPVTPSSGLSFRFHTRQQSSNFSSIDSNGLPTHHPIAGRPNREMTLRMTLTRPDLRADEEQLYGWQGPKNVNTDPFALEELQLTDDMSGTKGPFYVKPKAQGNLVSRLFKRASKKSR
ncbi:hypothetical protein CC80DRAFT_495715 [Byssothecium circinans]|uniref:Uncharacterized protein n=1 Tax=Byssothecium circinans TaxID=147558 RepID=A0A6A5THI0_9PLEO|nr:hypothetical protein CC80DRAFT_495715 [Byssothecium circinans]